MYVYIVNYGKVLVSIVCFYHCFSILLDYPVPAFSPYLALGKGGPGGDLLGEQRAWTPGLAALRCGLRLDRGCMKMHFSELLLELIYEWQKVVKPPAPDCTASLEG